MRLNFVDNYLINFLVSRREVCVQYNVVVTRGLRVLPT